MNLDIIAALGQIAAVLTVLGGLFSYAVIRPLNESIKALKDTVDEMRREIKEGREQRQGSSSEWNWWGRSPCCDNASGVRRVAGGGRTWWDNYAWGWDGVAPACRIE